ncbi:hypothetical protein [Streptomyces sp. A1136]|uniref:hypothetical protein n=1 Tax=Streptomyces sp. A1136 TaxID=2563102 RepID=UPI00109EA2FC|nr:hypothetical protein [Streptomyces sp. A1136]THA56087.1 hypothetical protein E6R62_12115 [Streptomyces sp. A1136]
MRVRSTVILAIAAITLTACSSSSDPKPSDKPAPRPSSSTPATTPSQSAPAAAALQLGQPAETVGAGGTGRLEITPTNIVYSTGNTFTKPTKATFAFVGYKARAVTAVAADQVAPIDGGGWSWIAPDGQAIAQGNGEAYNVTAESFNAGRTVQPGSFVLDGAVFDLDTVQAGGTLIYTDGEGKAYRWTMPKQDTGPEAAQIKKELAS